MVKPIGTVRLNLVRDGSKLEPISNGTDIVKVIYEYYNTAILSSLDTEKVSMFAYVYPI